MSPLHGAIQWESLAGTHSHNSTERHVFGQHAPPTSIGLLYVSILRNHCHQTLDRATGTIHRTASMASATEYSAITIAASGHWPMMKAPVTLPTSAH